MRIVILIILVLTGLISCNRADKKDAASIAFTARPVQSPSLLVTPSLKGFPDKQALELKLTLKNLATEKITVTEVSLQNQHGLKSLPESIDNGTWSIAKSEDTTLLLTFNPVNDKLLFQATGLPGLLDSAYHLSVFYSVDGKEGTRVVNLIARMPPEDFLSYRKGYEEPVQIYYLNTANGFAEKQRQFLKTNGSTNTSPFVNITQQEIAVSGLNFRVKCFHLRDSLHAELFIVNHSDMTIRIDTSKLDMIINNIKGGYSPAELRNEKVTGSTDEADILRKGDRTVIRMRKHVAAYPEQLVFTMGNVFFLSDNRPLFNGDLELVRYSQ